MEFIYRVCVEYDYSKCYTVFLNINNAGYHGIQVRYIDA